MGDNSDDVVADIRTLIHEFMSRIFPLVLDPDTLMEPSVRLRVHEKLYPRGLLGTPNFFWLAELAGSDFDGVDPECETRLSFGFTLTEVAEILSRLDRRSAHAILRAVHPSLVPTAEERRGSDFRGGDCP